MQTRLPGDIGIQELRRVCSSEPSKFGCLIIHLVGDPRAVVSSLIIKKFYMPYRFKKKLVTTRNTTPGERELRRNISDTLRLLVQENLNYVNEEWSSCTILPVFPRILQLASGFVKVYKPPALKTAYLLSSFLRMIPKESKTGDFALTLPKYPSLKKGADL